jgi:Zn finger protein HypA/HybF involved in hydrogenase expression
MHEKGIADDIFQALLAETHKAGATRITGAAVEVGELAGVTPGALVHGIEHCAEHEGMAPFPVDVTVLQAEVRCARCGDVMEEGGSGQCPECGGRDVRVEAATRIRITRVEYE